MKFPLRDSRRALTATILVTFSILAIFSSLHLQLTYASDIVRVQGNARGTATSSSTISITLTSAPITGNVLIATIGLLNSPTLITVSSITQTGVTWNFIVGNRINGDTDDVEIWYGAVQAGASAAITVNLSNTLNSGWAAVADVCEYSGVSNNVDAVAKNSGSSSTSDTGTTGTTTSNGELWIGAIFVGNIGITQSSPKNGFTLLDGAATGYPAGLAYLEKIVSATGTANSGTTLSSSVTWNGVIATFKGSSATTTGSSSVSSVPTSTSTVLATSTSIETFTSTSTVTDTATSTVTIHVVTVTVTSYVSTTTQTVTVTVTTTTTETTTTYTTVTT